MNSYDINDEKWWECSRWWEIYKRYFAVPYGGLGFNSKEIIKESKEKGTRSSKMLEYYLVPCATIEILAQINITVFIMKLLYKFFYSLIKFNCKKVYYYYYLFLGNANILG